MIVQAVVIYGAVRGCVHGYDLAAIFIISINTGAYMAEIIWRAASSPSIRQFEAAHAIGMTHWQTMTTVALPQAIRNILPSVGNELIVNIMIPALNVISVSELFFQAERAPRARITATSRSISSSRVILHLILIAGASAPSCARWRRWTARITTSFTARRATAALDIGYPSKTKRRPSRDGTCD